MKAENLKSYVLHFIRDAGEIENLLDRNKKKLNYVTLDRMGVSFHSNKINQKLLMLVTIRFWKVELEVGRSDEGQ